MHCKLIVFRIGMCHLAVAIIMPTLIQYPTGCFAACTTNIFIFGKDCHLSCAFMLVFYNNIRLSVIDSKLRDPRIETVEILP